VSVVPGNSAIALVISLFTVARIELLDDEDVPCMTTTEPAPISQPNNGTNGGVPSIPPSDQEYDCALDSLAYYSDGRLVLVRPTVLSQDEIIQCDFGSNTSGCAVQITATGNTFQVFGDPTLEDVLVTLRPSTQTAWFPIVFNTSTTFNASFPIAVGNWSLLYNISDINVTNCTSADPLYDPLPLGWGCYSVHVSYM
jgi:hypothetical protein